LNAGLSEVSIQVDSQQFGLFDSKLRGTVGVATGVTTFDYEPGVFPFYGLTGSVSAPSPWGATMSMQFAFKIIVLFEDGGFTRQNFLNDRPYQKQLDANEKIVPQILQPPKPLPINPIVLKVNMTY
jgi:hypothetical protein